MKTQELLKHYEELANSIVTDPDKLEQFVKGWGKGFHDYSFTNTLLILFQKQDATLCAGYHQWLKNHRCVRKGEHGIAIFAPIYSKARKDKETGELEDGDATGTVRHFIPVHVFDVSQTEGEPVDLGHSEMVHGGAQVDLDTLAALFGYPMVIDEAASQSNGHTDGRTITVTRKDNKASMLSTYFHELAHCELGHQNGHKDMAKPVKELEAEAVAYLVCRHLEIQNDRARYYIGKWAGKEDLGRAGSRVLKTAEAIIRKIDKREEKGKWQENNRKPDTTPR